MPEKTKVYDGPEQSRRADAPSERVKVFEQKNTRMGMWMWLIPLLVVLGIGTWLLSRSHHPAIASERSLGYVNFDTDQATITSESQATLDRAADRMKKNPDMRVRVQGFTDNTGDPAHNLALSNQRSQAVTQYLAAKGIAESRLDPHGFGESNPVASNSTADGKANNRRVELFQE